MPRRNVRKLNRRNASILTSFLDMGQLLKTIYLRSNSKKEILDNQYNILCSESLWYVILPYLSQ